MINEADLDGVKELNPLNHSRVAAFAYDPRTAMRGHLAQNRHGAGGGVVRCHSRHG
jgi:hypothetical protein